MNVLEAIKQRRSTREFSDKPVPREVMDEIIKYAYMIPSAGGLYPIQLFYKDYPLPGIIISAIFEKTMEKYGERGIRYVLLEAGHTAQNICLVCEEMGLKSCCIGAFDDRALRLRLDKNCVPLYVVAIGYPK